MSNYPEGVSDRHPHFNPRETSAEVECGNDEVIVVPSFYVKGELNEAIAALEKATAAGWAASNAEATSVLERLRKTLAGVYSMEKSAEYECPYKGEQDLPVSAEALWDCPLCGDERSTDTTEDHEDDDYDRYRESRYDD